MSNDERENMIDFEYEFFNVVGPTNSDAIAWGRSIAARVERQTALRFIALIERSNASLTMNRIEFLYAQPKVKGAKEG